MSFNRTVDQRREALVKANCTRTARAGLKEELKLGSKRGADVIEHPPAFILKMKVYDLLLAIPQVGKVKANKTLGACSISATKTIGGLSMRQRQELARYLRRARLGMNSPSGSIA